MQIMKLWMALEMVYLNSSPCKIIMRKPTIASFSINSALTELH